MSTMNLSPEQGSTSAADEHDRLVPQGQLSVYSGPVGEPVGTNPGRRVLGLEIYIGRVSQSSTRRGNRNKWNAWSDTYQADHGDQLAQAGAGWGTWSIPESQLNALGDVS